MIRSASDITILVAEDDPDDRLLTRDAFEDSGFCCDVRFVEDGVELLDYLRRRGKYAGVASAPRPGLVLLDLNMPRCDGREALTEIKADPQLRQIPVVVLTTSRAPSDILRSYQLGAASYIAKPVTYEGLVNALAGLQSYWLRVVHLPPATEAAR